MTMWGNVRRTRRKWSWWQRHYFLRVQHLHEHPLSWHVTNYLIEGLLVTSRVSSLITCSETHVIWRPLTLLSTALPQTDTNVSGRSISRSQGLGSCGMRRLGDRGHPSHVTARREFHSGIWTIMVPRLLRLILLEHQTPAHTYTECRVPLS